VIRATLCMPIAIACAMHASTTHADQRLTLAIALEQARARAPEVAPRVFAARAAEFDARAAGGACLPTLTVSASSLLGYVDQPYLPGNPPLRNAARTLLDQGVLAGRAVLFDFGQCGARAEAAKTDAVAARADIETARRRAEAEAAAAYLSVQAARRLLVHERETMRRSEERVTIVGELSLAGRQPAADIIRAAVELAQARLSVDAAAIEIERGEAELAVALGFDPRAQLDLSLPDNQELRETDAIVAHIDLDAIADALPAVAAAQGRAGGAENAALAASLSRLPIVSFAGNASLGDTQILAGYGIAGYALALDAGLRVTWALDLSAGDRAHASAAIAAQRRSEVDAERLRSRLAIQRLMQDIRSARVTLEDTRKLLELARTSEAAQLERYRGGMGTLLEWLDAERARRSAEVGCIHAELAYDIARSRLLVTVGRLP
jgi:outer membrane protein TolC